MGNIRIAVQFDRAGLADKLSRISQIVELADKEVEQVALESLSRVVERTPTRYTGAVRKAWVHRKLGLMQHLVTNPSKVMGWLERGTRAHGPVNAKALFIPLNRRAAEAGPRGVMEANARAVVGGQWRNYTARAAGKKGRAVKKPFVVGDDFVWAKRVKGIKPMHIARDEQRFVKKELKTRLMAVITNLFK